MDKSPIAVPPYAALIGGFFLLASCSQSPVPASTPAAVPPPATAPRTVVIQPAQVLCGTQGRNNTPSNEWISDATDCAATLASTPLSGQDIAMHATPAIQVKFNIDPAIQHVQQASAQVDMLCKSHISFYYLTALNEWQPTPDAYYACNGPTHEQKVADIPVQISSGTASLLITPGTGDSDVTVRQVTLKVTYAP